MTPFAAPPAAIPAPVADPVAAGSAGQSEPAAPAAAPQTRAKTKGVADVVFLIDVSGSMAPIIDALRKNIEAFVDSLSSGGANNAAPVRDWRGKVVGYRDIEAASSEGIEWIEDHPFVRDTAALKAQLASLRAAGRRRRARVPARCALQGGDDGGDAEGLAVRRPQQVALP